MRPGLRCWRPSPRVDRVDAVHGEPRATTARGSASATPTRRAAGSHVEVGDSAYAPATTPGEGHADGGAVLLGYPAEPGLDDLADLGDLRSVSSTSSCSGGGTSDSNAAKAPRAQAGRRAWRSVRSSVQPRAREEHVTCDVAPRTELLSHLAYLRLVEISARTVEERHRLAHTEVAGRPGVGPAERPGEEPVGRPAAEAPLRGDRPITTTSGRARERVEVERPRARPVTYSAFRVEKPTSRISLSGACAIRSRDGKAQARSCRNAEALGQPERTANAEWSETCWAVIEVTSISQGSGTRGGR